MIHYSVLVPHRDTGGAISRLMAQLSQAIEKLVLPYEIICIDDASAAPGARVLEDLLEETSHLRVLRFDRPRGTSAALCAGTLAARGDLVIAVGADTRFSMRYLPHLIARLSQCDFVFARNQRPLAVELGEPIAQLPRLLAGAGQLHRSEDIFWAARREAVADLALARGTFRVLPALVAKRGFTVCQLTLAPGLPPQGAPFRTGWLHRLATGWLDRRFEPHLARELARGDLAAPRLRIGRADVMQGRVLPPTATVPVEDQGRDSA
jgi:hypothetical protein